MATSFVEAQENLEVKYYPVLPKRSGQKNLSVYTPRVKRCFEILDYRPESTLTRNVELLTYLYGIRDKTSGKKYIGKKFNNKSQKDVCDMLDKWYDGAPKTTLPLCFDYTLKYNICIMGGVPATLLRSLEGLQAYIRECKKKNINWEEKAQKIFVLIDSKRSTQEIIEETKNKDELFASIASKCIIVDDIHAPHAALFAKFFRGLKNKHGACLKNTLFIGTAGTTHRAKVAAKKVFADGAVENLSVIQGEFDTWHKKAQAYGYDKKGPKGFHLFLTSAVQYDLINVLERRCR